MYVLEASGYFGEMISGHGKDWLKRADSHTAIHEDSTRRPLREAISLIGCAEVTKSKVSKSMHYRELNALRRCSHSAAVARDEARELSQPKQHHQASVVRGLASDYGSFDVVHCSLRLLIILSGHLVGTKQLSSL